MWSRILAAKKLLSNINSPVQVQLPLPSTICCHFRQLLRKILCRISISQSSFEMLFQHLSLRSLLNVTSAVRQAVERTSWFKNVSVIVCAVLARNQPSRCAHSAGKCLCAADGVLSTFLVSWLGKRGHGRGGLADSFNMVIMSFFCRHRSGHHGGGGLWPRQSAIGGGRGRPRASRWPL